MNEYYLYTFINGRMLKHKMLKEPVLEVEAFKKYRHRGMKFYNGKRKINIVYGGRYLILDRDDDKLAIKLFIETRKDIIDELNDKLNYSMNELKALENLMEESE